ncbi:MAG: hypothetical protein FWC80_00465 [Firmicutes bacterium]|nr:hypothetical protein [Bacillota bacterium]
MKTIYFFDHESKRVTQEVSDEVADVIAEARRAEWRNEAKERYYRHIKLNKLNDRDEEIGSSEFDPEYLLVQSEEHNELRAKLKTALQSLTPEQRQLVIMLKNGISVTDIATKLGVDKSAISHMRKRIQEKIKKYLV